MNNKKLKDKFCNVILSSLLKGILSIFISPVIVGLITLFGFQIQQIETWAKSGNILFYFTFGVINILLFIFVRRFAIHYIINTHFPVIGVSIKPKFIEPNINKENRIILCIELIKNCKHESENHYYWRLSHVSEMIKYIAIDLFGPSNILWRTMRWDNGYILIINSGVRKSLEFLEHFHDMRTKKLRQLSGLPLDIRISLHYGLMNAVEDPEEIIQAYGKTINTAIRIANICSKEQILASQDIYKLTQDHSPDQSLFERVGKYRLEENIFDLYNIFSRNRCIGITTKNNIPLKNRFYKTDELKPLMDLLKQKGIGPSNEIRNFLCKQTYEIFWLAIDDVILIHNEPTFQGYTKDRIYVMVDNDIPPIQNIIQLAKNYLEIVPEEKNRPKFYIQEWMPPLLDEGDFIKFKFGKSFYRWNKAIEMESDNELFLVKDYKAPISLRMSYIDGILDFWNDLPNMIIVTPIILTSDEHIILMKRSNRGDYYSLCWSITFEEQMDPSKEEDQELFLLGTAIRGLREEIGKQENGDDLIIEEMKVLGFYREWVNLNINFAVIVRLNHTKEELMAAWLRGPVDKGEHVTMDWLAIDDIDNVTKVLKWGNYYPSNPKNKNMMDNSFHGGSKLRLLLAILSIYGYDEVHKSIERL